MENDYNYPDIENYLGGRMDISEKEAFEKKMKGDPKLAEEVDFYQKVSNITIWKALFEEAEEELSGSEEKVAKKNELSSAKVRRLNAGKVFAYAASFILLIVIGAFWYANANYSNEALSEIDSIRLDMENGTRRGDETIVDIFDKGINALKNEQYNIATKYFDSIPDSSESYTLARLFLAYSQIKALKFESAIINADIVINISASEPNRQKAQWLKIQAMLQSDPTSSEFGLLLDQVTNDDTHMFQKKASQLEDKLNSVWRKLTF